jgi:phospholipase/lecithinase/hemolysin
MCSLLLIATLFFPLFSFASTPVKSMVVFGDSLSDIGNTTHLLKSLRKEESPALLVRPLKVYVINRMTEFADAYYVPQMILDAGINQVTEFFDFQLAPILADLVGAVKKVPILPGKPYWQSRFSNGRVWFEHLAPMLKVDKEERDHFVNNAFGGSWAMMYNQQLTVWNFIRHPILTLSTIINGKLIPPSLGLTVQAYLMENDYVDPDAIYFIFSGNNDYINVFLFEQGYDPDILNSYVDNVINDLSDSISKLHKAGARKFVIMGLPHAGNTPRFVYSSDREILNRAIDQHNEKLNARVELLQQSNEDMDLMYFDSDNILQRALTHPANYGFSNVKDACIDVKLPIFGFMAEHSPFKNNFILQYAQVIQHRDKHFLKEETNYSVCESPESYLFWDEIHISTKAHNYLAYEVCEAMKAHGYEADCQMPI